MKYIPGNMGEAELDNQFQLIIRSHFVTYGNAADEEITEMIRDEIETLWNEPKGTLLIGGSRWLVVFRITADFRPSITPVEIFQNLDAKNNYFRIEEFAHGNISFVDGLGCNSGYFKLENLYKGSTTAAHEYGHTLGLKHPENLDIRGLGRPAIMYPRGTLVDPPYQYDPSKPAGFPGGTMHPMYRRVLQADIESLKLHRLSFANKHAVIGEFTNVYHPNHAQIDPADFMRPPVDG